MKISVERVREILAKGDKNKHRPGYEVPKGFEYDNNIRNMHLISMRLRLNTNTSMQDTFPFKHISTYADTEQAHVFIVTGKGAVTLQDDPGLFPSDALIAQLRLLMG